MLLASLTLLAAQAAAPALPQLTALQQGALTCSAAFALDASRPDADARKAARGREFFVRTLARIMDETGAGREAIVALVGAEAQRLAAEPGRLASVLPPCRTLLDTSGIP